MSYDELINFPMQNNMDNMSADRLKYIHNQVNLRRQEMLGRDVNRSYHLIPLQDKVFKRLLKLNYRYTVSRGWEDPPNSN